MFNHTKKITKVSLIVFLLFVFSLAFYFVPVVYGADDTATSSGLVQCGRGADGPSSCDFEALESLVNRVFDYLMDLMAIIATFVIVWAGIMTIKEAYEGKASTVYKDMLWNVVIGFFFAVCAYAIVKTIITLAFDSGTVSDAIQRVFGG